MAKGYLGPASQKFLSNELHALGVTANTVEPHHIPALSEAIREHAARLMTPDKATQLADAIAHCEGFGAPAPGHGHKLASDAAAKLLADGKLRQAEKAYTELVAKHGDRDAYVGLARAQAAVEDHVAAIETLREGAAKMARAGDRGNAVSLLAEAVTLVPLDLSAHRRLAAALANQGDLGGAVAEYARFVDAAVSNGDSRRALLELAYGRETLGDLPGLIALVDRTQNGGPKTPPLALRVDAPRPAAKPPFRMTEPPAPSVATAASFNLTKQPVAPKTQAPPALQVAKPMPQVTPKAAPEIAAAKPAQPIASEELDPRLAALQSLSQPAVEPALQPVAKPVPQPLAKPAPQPVAKAAPQRVVKAKPQAQAPAAKVAPTAEPKVEQPSPRTRPDASETAVILKGARTFTHAEPMDAEAPVDVLLRAGVVKPKAAARPAMDIEPLLKSLTPTGSGLEAAAMAASRAALLTSARDIRATDAALDAARRLLSLGKLPSASDVLLDLIGHGFADREAQRLLIEVDCALGRRDVAKEKCNLLGHAYRLDGRTDVADDVERLARIL